MRELLCRYLGAKMILVCLCILSVEFARANEYALHKDSKISFKLKKFGMLDIEGIFKHFNGVLKLNDSGEIADLFIEVESNSLSTGNPKRDKYALESKFLNASVYPKISLRFVSYIATEFKDDVQKGKLIAVLDLHGVSKNVEFLSILYANSNSPRLEITGKINSKDFAIEGSMTSSREIRLILQMKWVEYV